MMQEWHATGHSSASTSPEHGQSSACLHSLVDGVSLAALPLLVMRCLKLPANTTIHLLMVICRHRGQLAGTEILQTSAVMV